MEVAPGRRGVAIRLVTDFYQFRILLQFAAQTPEFPVNPPAARLRPA
jgi:hypothetical protein